MLCKWAFARRRYPLLVLVPRKGGFLKTLALVRRLKMTKVVRARRRYHFSLMEPAWPSPAYDRMIARGGLNLGAAGSPARVYVRFSDTEWGALARALAAEYPVASRRPTFPEAIRDLVVAHASAVLGVEVTHGRRCAMHEAPGQRESSPPLAQPSLREGPASHWLASTGVVTLCVSRAARSLSLTSTSLSFTWMSFSISSA